jgi:hypothetical protein
LIGISAIPAPELLSQVNRILFGIVSSRGTMIGDTPHDVEAAARAGVGTIAFRCGGWSDQSFRDAIAIYDGPWDLLVRLDSSPVASRTAGSGSIAEEALQSPSLCRVVAERHDLHGGVAHLLQETVQRRALHQNLPASPRGLAEHDMRNALTFREGNQAICGTFRCDPDDCGAEFLGQRDVPL